MSFLKPDAAALSAAGASGAANGLGRLIDVDPSRIDRIAGGIGKAANGIAAAGGATPGYVPQQAPQQPVNNYMQLLDPNVLRAIYAKFGGGPVAPGNAR